MKEMNNQNKKEKTVKIPSAPVKKSAPPKGTAPRTSSKPKAKSVPAVSAVSGIVKKALAKTLGTLLPKP